PAVLCEGAVTRSKATVDTTYWLWADIDFKDHLDTAPEEIQQRIAASPFPPTLIVASGHGLHVYWKLNERLDIRPDQRQSEFETALKRAGALVGADTASAEASRFLRLPGSHNSKNGSNAEVTFNFAEDRHYEFSDLVNFLLNAQPIIPAPHKKNNE